MDVLKNVLVQSGLNALDPKPVNVSREDYYLSSLVCKNLSDLCDTGAAILESLNRPQNDTELPNKSLIQLASDTLKTFYSNEMFILDPSGEDTMPSWPVITNFRKDYLDNGYKIFRAIRNNINKNPDSALMLESIEKRDKNYFLLNFDKIFQDVPFTDTIKQFKNFLSSNLLSPDDEELLWEFFHMLLHFFTNEKEILTQIRQYK